VLQAGYMFHAFRTDIRLVHCHLKVDRQTLDARTHLHIQTNKHTNKQTNKVYT